MYLLSTGEDISSFFGGRWKILAIAVSIFLVYVLRGKYPESTDSRKVLAEKQEIRKSEVKAPTVTTYLCILPMEDNGCYDSRCALTQQQQK